MDKILDAQERLTDLDNPQIEIHLLKRTLSLCKLNHLLSTVPVGSADVQLARFDSGLRWTLGNIILSSVSDVAWSQATLPFHLGGFGVHEVVSSSAAAFLGSCNATHGLVGCLLNQTAVSSSPSTLCMIYLWGGVCQDSVFQSIQVTPSVRQL